VSECRVTGYCAFTGVSLSLLTVALLIDRQAEHIQFVPAGAQNMYILHLQHTELVCLYLQRTEHAHFLMKLICIPFSIILPAFPPKTGGLPTVKYIMNWGPMGGVHTFLW
jgi:hypothetical protein